MIPRVVSWAGLSLALLVVSALTVRAAEVPAIAAAAQVALANR